MDHPESMIGIEITAPGGAECLQPVERPVPRPGPGQALVKVEAAGVNRPDVLQRLGLYAPPPGVSDIPGLEVAGHVVSLGAQCPRWQLGDKVTALVGGGGYAQYCVADWGSILPLPDSLSFSEAAGLPETTFTVWHNVFQRGALKAGETLLVHGGASGIGTTAIQLAKAKGAKIAATAGSDKKCEVCKKLGADRAINYLEADFVEAVKDLTDGRGADVILDMVGGDYVDRNYAAAAMDGRIVQIAFLGGQGAEVDFRPLMIKRLVHTGSTLRPRSTEFKAALASAIEADVWPLIAGDQYRPVIDSVFPLSDAAQAHRRIDDPAHIGKIILAAGDTM